MSKFADNLQNLMCHMRSKFFKKAKRGGKDVIVEQIFTNSTDKLQHQCIIKQCVLLLFMIRK